MSTRRAPAELVPVDWTGEHPPAFSGTVPKHIAIVMDGNGRWANRRGLPRVEGHRQGEQALLDGVAGALQGGGTPPSGYPLRTWRRSPDEVRFLMGFNRDVLRRRRAQLHAWNVRMRWAGRRPRLWGSVVSELRASEQATARNTGLTLTMCVNYGGRNEITDAVRAIAEEVAAGRLSPHGITERTIARHLYVPELPEVDLFLRSSGEQRISNFMLWQSAYAEMVFLDPLWPDFDRRELWRAIGIYQDRDRRFGGAVDAPATPAAG